MLLHDKRWYETAYRRAVIDMHIPDWDEKFLSQFDADQYVEMLVKSRAQSIVAYGQSHVGLFNYPTKVGQQHRGLKGRNILGEVIERCHAHDIAVVIYTSLIFDRWAADQHPEWRMVTHDGKPQGEGGRHGVLCPNSPYREYVRAFVEEICRMFDFEGMRFDMTFWPSLCFCQHCQKRFADEVGGEIPRTIDWLDERWVAFARRREAWLAEFAAVATDTVRKLKPNGHGRAPVVDLSAELAVRRRGAAGAAKRFSARRLLRRLAARLVRPQAARRPDAATARSATRPASRWSCATTRA